MATSADDSPKTLFAAKEENKDLKARIASLQAQLGNGPPKPRPAGGTAPPKKPPYSTKPVKREDEDPHPVFPGRTVPIPKSAFDLAAMSPAQLRQMLENTNDTDLLKMLSEETAKGRKTQDANLIARIYRELKRRGA
jgi:hypothetical protein